MRDKYQGAAVIGDSLRPADSAEKSFFQSFLKKFLMAVGSETYQIPAQAMPEAMNSDSETECATVLGNFLLGNLDRAISMSFDFVVFSNMAPQGKPLCSRDLCNNSV